MKSKNSKLKIALLDSGSGGLAILKELRTKLPQADYDYLCDNSFFPFGEQKSEFILTRFVNLALTFYEREKPDLMVIACNTASTIILEDLRKQINIPIVGVVPAVKTASELSKSQKIGILATKRTIESDYLEQLIQDFASSCQVVKKASPELVNLSEKKINGENTNLQLIQKEIQIFLDEKDLDTVVLGCTHFSQIIPELQAASTGNSIAWIDSTEAIVKRVLSLLSAKITPKESSQGRLRIFHTGKNLNKKAWEKHISSIHSFHLFL